MHSTFHRRTQDFLGAAQGQVHPDM